MGMGERHRDGEGGRGSIAAAAAGRDLEGNLNPCQASEEGRKGPSLLLSFVRLICMTPFPPYKMGYCDTAHGLRRGGIYTASLTARIKTVKQRKATWIFRVPEIPPLRLERVAKSRVLDLQTNSK